MSYSTEDEKQATATPFDANRAKSRQNKLSAISSFVSQNQNTTNPNVVAMKAGQQNKTVGAVNKAQTDTNGLTVQTGQGIQDTATKDTTGAGLQVTGTTLDTSKPLNTQAVTKDERKLNALDTKMDDVEQLAKTGKASVGSVDIDNALTQEIASMTKKKAGILAAYNSFNKALDDNALKDIAALDTQVKTAQDELASNSTTNLAEIGATNALESEALDQSDALTTGNSGNVGFLKSLFGPGYDAGKFGGLDSQIYNKDINQARDDAKANVDAMQVAKGGKANAINAYLTNVKQSKETIDKFSGGFRDQVADAKKVGKKTYDDATDALDKRFTNDVDVTTKYATSLKDKGVKNVADVASARKAVGDTNFDRWVKNLDNGDAATDFNYTTKEGDVSDSRDVGKDMVGREGLEKTVAQIRKAMYATPGNQTLSALYTRAQKAYDDLIASEGREFTARKQAEAEAERKRKEDEEYRKRNPTEKGDSASVQRSERNSEKNAGKGENMGSSKAEKADKSKN